MSARPAQREVFDTDSTPRSSVFDPRESANLDVADTVVKLRDAGFSLKDIAGVLNGQGHLTRMGKPWTDVAVLRVVRRQSV